MALDTVCALHDEYVRVYWRNLSLDQMSVLFPRVVASVQNLETGDVDQEHTSTKDVASMVGRESDTRTRSDDLVGGDRDDGG